MTEALATGLASSALDVKQLQASYGKSQILFGLDLRVPQGRTVAILGRNGAGKTTALGALAGLVTARADAINVRGTDVRRLPAYRRVRLGMSLVPSGSRSFTELTVEENLTLVRSAPGKAHAWPLEAVYATFPKLAARRKARATSLSGGERQMLAIGRALRTEPTILMMDEPTEGLAPLVIDELAHLILRLNQASISILLAEQNHKFALRVSSYANFVEKGRIVWHGAAGDAGEADVLQRYLGV
jgi:branched-chain amino acid transport system ATP-binding protein